MKDRKAETYMTPGELQWMYWFDFASGAIYHRLTGERVDKVFAPWGACRAEPRLRQVEVPCRGGYVRFYAHRMMWAAGYGRWPARGKDIDHRNADVQDNRLVNLTEVTDAECSARARIKRFVFLLQTHV